ncbi:hypothetical protein [Faecalimicrobium dakarense]|uniref:hypothetical protein n=1 Tax=Faecalimicrobium dakarense TaxID=1301100 RepID=UPI0004B059CB|nr:hypothetical protein [[Clostridium] dakarense]
MKESEKFEIGGEYNYSIENISSNILENKNSLFEYIGINESNTILFNACSSAIKYLIENIIPTTINRILLPSYLCSCITEVIEACNIEFEFYRVNQSLELDIYDLGNKLKGSGDCIFFINYFGFSQPQYIIEYLNKIKETNLLIEDCTHSIFNKDACSRYIGHYQVASLRKWTGIPDGGILIDKNNDLSRYKLNKGYDEFFVSRFIGHLMKDKYLKGGQIDKNIFLSLFNNAEEAYDNEMNIFKISNISYKLLNSINYKKLMSKRNQNYKFLVENLNEIEYIEVIFKDIKEYTCPIGLPVIVKNINRDKFRKYLSYNGVYCPIHWIPDSYTNTNFEDTSILSKKILTIPCDQRYSEIDMKYIIKTIKEYY